MSDDPMVTVSLPQSEWEEVAGAIIDKIIDPERSDQIDLDHAWHQIHTAIYGTPPDDSVDPSLYR